MKQKNATTSPYSFKPSQGEIRTHFATWYAAIILLIILFLLGSCRSWKGISHEVNNTTTSDSSKFTKKLDSLSKIVTSITKVKEKEQSSKETEIIDTAVGFKGRKVGLILGSNIRVDTFVDNDGLHLHVYTDIKGNQHIDVDLDSVTVIFQRFKREHSVTNTRYDSVVNVNESLQHFKDSVSNTKAVLVANHTEVKVLQEQKNWFGRQWQKLKDKFAWFGLICFFLIILWIIWKLGKGYLKAQFPILNGSKFLK